MYYEKQLKMIQTIAEYENITKAAEKLYVSQPYLSKLLRETEAELGVKLFDRLHRSVKITYAGESYLEYLEKLFSLEKNMYAQLAKAAEYKAGRIILGINPALGTSILPIILPAFNKKYPAIKIELYEEDAITLENLLENNVIDLAIGMMPIYNSNLVYELIYEDDVHFIVGENSKLYDPDNYEITPFPFDLDVLHDEPIITLSSEYGIRRLVDDFYEKNHLVQNISLTTSTIYTAGNLVRKGFGSTFMPTTGMASLKFKNCNIYTFDTDTLKAGFSIFYRKNKELTPPERRFIGMTIKLLQESYQGFYINPPVER